MLNEYYSYSYYNQCLHLYAKSKFGYLNNIIMLQLRGLAVPLFNLTMDNLIQVVAFESRRLTFHEGKEHLFASTGIPLRRKPPALPPGGDPVECSSTLDL